MRKINIKIYYKSLALVIINMFLLSLLLIPKTKKSGAQFFYTSLVEQKKISDINEIIFTLHSNSIPEELSSITFIKKKDDFILKTFNGEYKLKKNIVKSFFDSLTKKQKFIFMTNDVKKYKTYGLDKDNALELKLVNGDKTYIAEILFGNNDMLMTSRYVRIDSRTNVYKMPDALSNFLTLRTDFWIELQIYKSLFIDNKIQAIEKNNKMILRNNKYESNFNELELFLKQFSCIDVFQPHTLVSTQTENLVFHLGNNIKITMQFTPLENGDYILFDSFSGNSFIISGYTKNRMDKYFAITDE